MGDKRYYKFDFGMQDTPNIVGNSSKCPMNSCRIGDNPREN